MTARILQIVLLCGAIVAAYAKSQSTPEGFAVGRLRTAIDLYRENNLGRLPTRWSDIDNRYVSLSSINEILHANRAEPIQRNYVFVSQPGLLDQRRRQVLMLRSAPIQEPGHPDPGRYMIVLNCADPFGIITTNCGPTLHWVKEPEVTKMIMAANVQLPPPDYEAAEAAEAAIRKKSIQMKEWDRQAEFTVFKLRFQEKLVAVKSWFVASAATNQIGNVSPSAGSRIKLGPTALLGVVVVSLTLFGVCYWKRRL